MTLSLKSRVLSATQSAEISSGKLVLLGENHLRTAVQEYVAHYHTERNHQGLEGQLIEPTANAMGAGPIICRERVGGLLHFYHRQAA